MKVKKAVIPCAGFGTRFLPVTKVVPKELFPIVDKPALQYIVEEAVASGVEEVLIVISPQKDNIIKYFTKNKALNKILLKNKKKEEYEAVNRDFGAKISFAEQKKMTGNGMAVHIAKEFAAGEPIAVLFGDDLMYTGDGVPVTKQLIAAAEATGKCVVGCQEASEEVARRCGVMQITETDGRISEISGIVEKPQEEIPSRLVSLGRFVLTPDIFDALEKAPTLNNEVYLTDAVSALAADSKVIAYEFEGKRYDIGNKEGFLEATVEFALRDEHLKDAFGDYLDNRK